MVLRIRVECFFIKMSLMVRYSSHNTVDQHFLNVVQNLVFQYLAVILLLYIFFIL